LLTRLASSTVTLPSRDGNFEPTVEILPDRIKGQDLALLKKKYPPYTLINRGGFHGLREEKIRSKVDKKLPFPQYFICHYHFFFFFSQPPPYQQRDRRWPNTLTTPFPRLQ
jgi:hypothetical protein